MRFRYQTKLLSALGVPSSLTNSHATSRRARPSSRQAETAAAGSDVGVAVALTTPVAVAVYLMVASFSIGISCPKCEAIANITTPPVAVSAAPYAAAA